MRFSFTCAPEDQTTHIKRRLTNVQQVVTIRSWRVVNTGEAGHFSFHVADDAGPEFVEKRLESQQKLQLDVVDRCDLSLSAEASFVHLFRLGVACSGRCNNSNSSQRMSSIKTGLNPPEFNYCSIKRNYIVC